MSNDYLAPQGWECPKCGRVYSPATEMCRYCGNYETTVTTRCIYTMRGFTPEEQEEYNKCLDKCYEPTGLNIYELSEKNNFNRIKRFNKDQMAKFIYGAFANICECCNNTGCGAETDEADCIEGIRHWLESEVEE